MSEGTILQSLGLEHLETFPRSVLPPTVKPILDTTALPWRLPGSCPPLPDLQTRAAADVDGLERIYWIWPPPCSQSNLPSKESQAVANDKNKTKMAAENPC